MSTDLQAGQYVIDRAKARQSSTLIQVAALAVAGLCIALAAWLQGPINQQRRDLQLVMQSDIYEELPPKYGLVSAMGGPARAFAVPFLWMRLERLKEDGQYYECHQLAKWICTLQPRFAQVWSFQSWNMAYNISVATHTAQERWQWVYNGIRLLRDEGIPNNERVVPLYHQLAWTWFHKVGERLDDFHNYYKRTWVATMQTLLGSPPMTANRTERLEWLRPVADAPIRLEDLIAERPGVGELIERLRGLGVDVTAGTNPERLFHPLEIRFFRPYTAWLTEQDLAALRTREPERTEQEKALIAFFDDVQGEDFDALLAWLRSKVLREQYKMDPDYMMAMPGRLGTDEPLPIDWRTPWAQSMYWAMYGVEQGSQLKNAKQFNQMNTDRIMLFSLAELAKQGRILFRINLDDPARSWLSLGPDYDYIEAMHRKYIEIAPQYAEPDEDIEGRTCEMLRSGHVNNLHDAIGALYLAGRKDRAEYYLRYLAEYYPHHHTGETQDIYLKSVHDFVLDQFKEQAESLDSSLSLIYSSLEGAYLALVTGDDREYEARMEIAREIHQHYQASAIDSPRGRMRMHDFPWIRAQALFDFTVLSGYPITIRSRVWKAEQQEVKRYAYDMAIDPLTRQCEERGLDVNAMFPEPSGMEAWREAHPAPLREEEQAERDQERKQEHEEEE